MQRKRVLLDAASFADSAEARATGVSAADLREVASRFLAACYDDLGKAPRLLDGDDMAQLLTEALPCRYGKKDRLAAQTGAVLGAYLEFLSGSAMVVHEYELRTGLEEHLGAFTAAVASGAAHAAGVVVTELPETIQHRAEKVGRNDPCPCGSGKKFKKCCARLG